MRYILLLTVFIINTALVLGQWTTKASVIGDPKNHPVTFSLDGKAYSVSGYNTSKQRIYRDAYQYDPQSDVWTKLKDFPGPARGFAAGAAFNGKGYMGFGVSSSSYLNDLWEYDPTNDSWKQLASCPGLARRHPVFTITENGKLYVGLGDGPNSSGTFDPGFKDWWEYDIANNTWTQKDDLPAAGRHHPYFFSIGTDVYAGFGDNHDEVFKDFYKFNSVNSEWTILNDFPGERRVAGAQFAYKGKGYIVDGEGSDHQNLDEGELHRYNPETDKWTTLAFHSGDGLWAPGAFVLDSMVYVVGGDDDDDVSSSTLWAYSLEEKPVDNALSENNGVFSLSNDFFDENASYQWVDCNNGFVAITGETGSSITIPVGESYALVVTYSEGGIDTSACYQASTSIGSLNNVAVSVYPNPSKDKVFIKSLDGNKIVSYAIVNTLGVQVAKGSMNVKGEINVADLNNGTYFLMLTNSDGGAPYVQKINKIGK